MKRNLGIIYAFAAYSWWGLIPIFWKHLDRVSSIEIVMHRMVWSCLIVISLIVLMRQWGAFSQLLKSREVFLRLFVASLLMSVNWAIFIWAVNSERIVETSLGYFMNPLISVLFGVIFFSERLRKGQFVAILIASMGVISMVVSYGNLPLVSLSLAITFSLYSVIKKTVTMPATHGMAIETAFMFLPALLYLGYLAWQQESAFGVQPATDVMLILAGPATLIPLILFAAAAKKVSMTALGMSQYIGPFMQLALAVWVYQEPFGSDHLLAFGLVWFALLIYSVEQVHHQRRVRQSRISAA